MSTNIDDSVFPDPRVLERMANAMFREQSDSGTPSRDAGFPGVATASSIQPTEQDGVNIERPQTSLRDPHFAGQQPVSATEAGRGISPEAEQISQFRPSHQQTLPDAKTTTYGVIPGSIAGSGISPSVTEHGKSFNINDPQTSHVDPHLATPGVVPGSLAGKGFSPEVPWDAFSAMLAQPVTPSNIPTVALPSFPGLGISPTAFQLANPAQGALPGVVPMPFGESSLEGQLGRQANAFFKEPVTDNSVPYIGHVNPNLPSFYFTQGYASSPFAKQGDLSKSYLALKDHHGLLPPQFDVNQVKNDFPILQERLNGKQLVWLDNAATTQKPRQVIERISYFYAHENSNIHRAAHALAARATDAYEEARRKVQHFLHAGSPDEIIFVRGATEAINLVAKSWGDQFLHAGDEIIVSHLEHHANIVPWQQLAWRKGLKLRVIPVDDTGQVLLDEYAKLLGPKTKLVAFTQVSNALGTVTPAAQIVEMAHRAGARVLVDGAQSVSHMPVDVQLLDCDWFVFSGHKVFGPTGIGVVYGKESLLNETQPWQGGGNMIADVTFEATKFQQAPSRFEAGTGNIADAVGLGAAIDYVTRIGMEAIHQYETYLLHYATVLMRDVPGLRMIGTAAEKASVLSFVFEGFRTDEVGVALNEEGIAVRAGHHCAQPILRRFGQETTVRPSLAFYNTCADVDLLIAVLHKLRETRPLKNR
jgi:cysteine desulfurase/selenocysteine lyase